MSRKGETKTKRNKKLKAIICLLCLCAILFTGCTRQSKALIDTDTLRVTTEGAYTTIYDLAGGAEYQYKTVRIKAGTGRTEPQTAASTDTITIILLQGGGFEVTDHTARKVYTIQRGRSR